jgi:hypothetical protein
MKIPQGQYNIRELCRTILDTGESTLFQDLHYHQIKTFLYLTSNDDWISFFDDYDQEDYGDVVKLTKEYRNRVGDKQEAVFYAGEHPDNVLMIFTGAVEDAIRQTLEVTESTYGGIEPMPIFPADFQKMNQYILSNYPDIDITEFKAVSQPDLAKAEIRPEIDDRVIEYKAADGRESLKEFREYYGVVPVRVQYEHRLLQFKMDTDGKFTITTINEDTFNLFFELVEQVVEHILNVQEVSESIRFRTETRRSGELDVQVPRMNSGQIQFTRDFNLLMAEHFMEHVSEREGVRYTFSDIQKQAGSLDLSARVTDEYHDSHFNISATEDAMTIVPKRNCTWGSILKFYHLFAQTVDEQSRLELFTDQIDSSAS